MTLNPMTLVGKTVPAPTGKAKHLIITLHGYGANAQDLLSLAPAIQNQFPDIAVSAPNAPHAIDMMADAYKWFDIEDRTPSIMQAGVASNADAVNAYIDEQMAHYGVDESNTMVLGFSQGTMLALHVGLRRQKQLAGILGFSGMLLETPTQLPDQIQSRPPVLLIHGQADDVIAWQATMAAADVLSMNNIPVNTVVVPDVPHGIDPVGFAEAMTFINKYFKGVDDEQ